jgi:hypothetical protein
LTINNVNLQIKFPPNTPYRVKQNLLASLNAFVKKNEAAIALLPEEKKEEILYKLVEKMLCNEGLMAKYKEYPKPAPDLSGIDLCEPF